MKANIDIAALKQPQKPREHLGKNAVDASHKKHTSDHKAHEKKEAFKDYVKKNEHDSSKEKDVATPIASMALLGQNLRQLNVHAAKHAYLQEKMKGEKSDHLKLELKSLADSKDAKSLLDKAHDLTLQKKEMVDKAQPVEENLSLFKKGKGPLASKINKEKHLGSHSELNPKHKSDVTLNTSGESKNVQLAVGDKVALKAHVSKSPLAYTSFEILSHKNSGNIHVLRVQLHPEDLGQVNVRLRSTQEGLHIELQAKDARTSALLAQDQDALKNILKAASVTDSGKVFVSVVRSDDVFVQNISATRSDNSFSNGQQGGQSFANENGSSKDFSNGSGQGQGRGEEKANYAYGSTQESASTNDKSSLRDGYVI